MQGVLAFPSVQPAAEGFVFEATMVAVAPPETKLKVYVELVSTDPGYSCRVVPLPQILLPSFESEQAAGG